MILFAACFGVTFFGGGAPAPEAKAPNKAPACAKALAASRPKLEQIRLEQRIAPTLALIGSSCRDLDPAMADAAAKANGKPRAERAAILAKGQTSCQVAAPTGPAEAVAQACPPAPHDPQGPILKQLDAGTYAYLRALRAKLEAAGVTMDAELVLSSLALAAAMEGEAAHERPAPAK